MSTPRVGHTSTLLSNGIVLVVGGLPDNFNSTTALATAELYNSATGTFTVTGIMGKARAFHAATLLNNGIVLLEGGASTSTLLLASAELYSPAAGTFAPTGSLNTAAVDTLQPC